MNAKLFPTGLRRASARPLSSTAMTSPARWVPGRPSSNCSQTLEAGGLVLGVVLALCAASCAEEVTADEVEQDPATAASDLPAGRLTHDPGTDEDGSFLLTEDGTLYFAWMSDRAGDMDIWMTRSVDGVEWAEPWPAVQTSDADLLNSLTRTSDGLYHLTGRRRSSVWDSSSTDLVQWSEPVEWTDPAQGWASGYFQEGRDGEYWLVFTSKRSGNHELYVQHSGDRGATWGTPSRITDDPQEDFYFSFRCAEDGTLLLVWERHDGDDRAGLYGRTTDLHLSTSADGITWTDPVLLTPESEGQHLDSLPALLEGPDATVFAAWLTDRVEPAPKAVMIPVWPNLDTDDLRLVPAAGYSIRSQRLRDGRTILAWVANPDRTRSDYFYRIVRDFDFEQVGR